MSHVLVISSDILPVSGQPTTGAGLRAWGLGQGLKSYGHDVEFCLDREVAHKCGYAGEEIRLFDSLKFDDFVRQIDPDILLFQHWPASLMFNEQPGAHVVIDFHGPALLEILFRQPHSVEKFVRQKLNAIARADYFTCAGNKQLHYFLAWLLLAGIDLHQFPISSIPFSMPSEAPNHISWPTDPTFVYGGVFLPWTDPALGLTILVQEMEQLGKGELRFFGGKHPWANLPSEKEFENLRTKLTQSKRVRFFPAIPRDELIEEYVTASVAWDLMARNPERELAFTSRTVEYLWCGLPVVYNNYAELADYINEYDAGWTVDPSDQEQIRKIVREIFNCPETVRRKGENAQRLVRDHLSWEHTVKPLADYCSHPYSAKRLSETPLIRSIEDCGFSAETLAMMSRFKAKVPSPVKRLAKTFVRRRSIDKKT